MKEILMATFTKRGDKWRAEVRLKNVRRSKTFSTKASAKLWVLQTESEVEDGVLGKIPNKHFGDLLERYSCDVSSLKIGHLREVKTIRRIIKDDVAKVPLAELSTKHIAAWRDRRLKEVSGSTVNREMNILSHACNIARKEWGWLKSSPTTDVRRPKENPPRTRRPTVDETDRLIHVSGYCKNEPPVTASARVVAAYLFAIETAMRAGEIAGLSREHVHDRHAHLPMTKNGTSRDVPLSTEARRILEQVMTVTKKQKHVFDLKASIIDALFRSLKAKAGVSGLTFHDTRREALTRLSRKYDVMDLAKVSGHKDLRILQNVYYAPSISYLSDKLD
jgi:integrase